MNVPIACLVLAAPVPVVVDYQEKADKARWVFSDDRATPAHSVKGVRGPYRAAIDRVDDFGNHTIRFTRAGKTVHTLEGHFRTVFAVQGSVLYYAAFTPYSSGCALVAFDLAAKKQLWKVPLKGMGPIPHTKYFNAVNLDLDGTAARVYGRESAGRYIEYVDLRKGKTVGHKVFGAEDKPKE